nr:MAG TPA: hypothetical protein [Caudoviricetes sp.]
MRFGVLFTDVLTMGLVLCPIPSDNCIIVLFCEIFKSFS